MHLRTVLIILFVAGLLALLALLPRTPLVLGWLWQNAERIAAEQGFRLSADQLNGNAWGGVSIEGLELLGPGVELSSQSTRVEYGLISLLRGRLSVGVEIAGLSGQVDPAALEFSSTAGTSAALPLDLHRVDLQDVDVSVAGFDIYLPDISIDELNVSTAADGNHAVNLELGTPDGRAVLSGHWLDAENRLDLHIDEADVRIARHWWPGAVAGNLTGQLRLSSRGFELDGYISDAAIDYLELMVTGISGPVTMHDLIVEGKLAGTGLDGPVQADITVDIPQLDYMGVLTGNPRLEAAVPWLGRTLATDLTGIQANGPMSLRTVVTGWYETLVTGTASGSGSLAGLPLESLLGTFDYSTERNVSVDVNALLAGGNVNVQIQPGVDQPRQLTVTAAEVQLADGADSGLQFDLDLFMNLDGRPGFSSQPSTGQLRLDGQLSGTDLQLQATSTTTDPELWDIALSGSILGQPRLSGALELDFSRGLGSGTVNMSGLEVPGLPWPLSATVAADSAPLEFPLPVTVAAESGPLALGPLVTAIDPFGNFSLIAADDSVMVEASDTGLHAMLSGPPLSITGPGPEPRPLELTGSFSSDAQGQNIDLSARYRDLVLEVSESDGDLVAGLLSGASDSLNYSFDMSDLSWQVDGNVPVTELAGLLGLPLDGQLAGSLQGQGLEPTAGTMIGQAVVAGQPVALELAADQGRLVVAGATELLGADWQLSGELLPGQELTASSELGTLQLDAGLLTGEGNLQLPEGIEVLSGDWSGLLPWRLDGQLEEGSAQLTTAASDLQVNWNDGLEFSAGLHETVRVYGQELRLDAEVARSGELSGSIRHEGGSLQLTGSLPDGPARFSGELPAALLHELLLGVVTVTGDLDWTGQPEFNAEFDWQQLTGRFSWQPDAQLTAAATAPGLELGFDGAGLAASFTGFEPGAYLDLPLTGLQLSGSAHGEPDGLSVELSGVTDWLAASVTGSLNLAEQPSADLAISASAQDGLLELAGSLHGSLAAPDFSATVSSEPLTVGEIVRVQALDLGLTLSPDGSLSLSGPEAQLQLVNGSWSGILELGLELQGEPHQLLVRPAGTELLPGLSGSLLGPLLSGQLALHDQLDFDLELGSSLRALPWLQQARLTGQAQLDGNWRARLDAEATAPLPDLEPLSIGAELEGDLSGFSGFGNVRAGSDAARLLSVTASSDWSGVLLSSDLASLDLSAFTAVLGVDSDLSSSGQAQVRLEEGVDWLVEGGISGSVAGIPLELQFEAGPGSVAASGLADGDNLELDISLAEQLTALGHWAGAELQFSSSADFPDRLSGRLVSPTESRLGELDLRLVLHGDAGAMELESLTGTVGPARLQLSGELLPATALSGSATVSQLEGELPLTITQSGDGLSGFTSYAGLQLRVTLAATGPELALSGQLPGQSEAIELGWNGPTGFSGSAHLDGTVGLAELALGWQLRADSTGDGRLAVSGLLHESGQRLAELEATLLSQPLQPAGLSGRVSSTVDLSRFVPLLEPRSISLSSSGRVSGSLTSPRFDGSLLLIGAISADGRIGVDADGATLSLSGPALELTADSDWRSWAARVEVAGASLERLTGLLPGASLDLTGSGSGDFTAAGSTLDVSSLVIATDRSRIDGNATMVDGAIGAELDVLLALEDVATGAALSGGTSGQLTLAGLRPDEPGSGTVSGELELIEVGFAGVFGLDGVATLSGSLAEPRIAAELSAGDDLLEVAWQPAAQQFRLVSRLNAGQLRTDFFIHSTARDGLDANGTINLPGGFFLVDTTTDGELSLSGRDAWSDWRLLLDPQSGQVDLLGDLVSLHPELQGQLRLQAALPEGNLQVSGGIEALRVFNAEIGDVPLRAAVPGPGLELHGERLAGRIMLDGDWQLSRLALDLTRDLNMVASGSGNLGSGILDASLAGRLLGQTVLGTAAASLAPGGVTVTALFGLLSGSASLEARLVNGSWQGSVALNQLSYAGVSLDGTGAISGPLESPQLDLVTDTGLLGLSGEGSLQLGPNLFSLYQRFADPALGGELVLEGSLHPLPELRLTGPDGNTFLLQQADSDTTAPVPLRQLSASGELNINTDFAELSLQAAPAGHSAAVFLAVPLLPGLAVTGNIALASLESLIDQLTAGIELDGRQETFGDLRLSLLSGELTLTEFGLQHPLALIEASGSISLSGNSRISGTITPAPGPLADLPALAEDGSIPFALIRGSELIRLVSSSDLGDLEASFSTASGSGTLEALLHSGGGNAEVRLSWNPANGITGSVTSSGLVLFEPPGGPPGRLDSALQLTAGRATGYVELHVGPGQITLNGHWSLADLLPPALTAHQETGGQLDLRVGAFELSAVPAIARYAPALRGGVTAVVQVRDDVIAGNLLAGGLQAAGAPLPVETFISGTVSEIGVAGTVAGSPLSLTLMDGYLSGLLEMRRFPLHTLAAAAAGPLDVLAEVTGVARFGLPLGSIGESEFRIATEQIRLERSGIVTVGNVSMQLAGGEFRLSEASFTGAGAWEASGVLSADELDFNLHAEEADFGPMLGLIPVLHELQVAAEGSLSLNASGTIADPQVDLLSDELRFTMAGISYRLEDLLLNLQQSQLTVEASLLATDPIQGELNLSGSSGISLSPLAFENARFGFAGSLVLPFVGQVEQIRGSIHSADGTAGAPLLTHVEAELGNPLTVSGSLAPLDLDVQGSDLLVNLPSILLTESRLDADLNLAWSTDLELSGNIVLHESTLTFSQSGGGPGLSSEGIAGRLRFNDVRIDAPARLRLAESFGNAELAGSLVVSGTLAEPQLAGRADSLRGTFQFAGRDFQLQEASALFEATRGLYPELRLTATTTFDRNRLVPTGSSLQVIAPVDGSAQVTLSFAGTIEPDPATGIRLNLDPVLTSNVIVQENRSDGLASAPRPLTEDELLSLITLGRAELGGIAGDAGLAPLVAQGAIETAVDMLLLSELQRALGEALGLDLVEIRSSALTNLLTGNGADQQFGISLRFGGYVSDEIFATYRLSAFDDPEGLYAFSNEVGIRYALGPVVLDLAGSLNVPDSPVLGAVAQLSLGVLYEINPRTTLEAAFDLSGDEQQFRFGVTWRW